MLFRKVIINMSAPFTGKQVFFFLIAILFSPFCFAQIYVDVNANGVSNLDGPEIWYSDPFGMNASTEPFPGSVRQWIARADNSAFDTHGPVIGKSRSKTYGDASVHPPN